MQKVQMRMNTVFILVEFYLVFVLDENNSKFRKKLGSVFFVKKIKNALGAFSK